MKTQARVSWEKLCYASMAHSAHRQGCPTIAKTIIRNHLDKAQHHEAGPSLVIPRSKVFHLADDLPGSY